MRAFARGWLTERKFVPRVLVVFGKDAAILNRADFLNRVTLSRERISVRSAVGAARGDQMRSAECGRSEEHV